MTTAEIELKLNEMCSIYKLTDEDIERLKNFLDDRKDVLQSIVINSLESIKCNLIYGFSFQKSIIALYRDSPIVSLLANNKAKYVLQICNMVKEPKNFDQYLSDNMFFQLTLYNCTEDQLIQFSNIIAQIKNLKGKIKRRDLDVMVTFQDAFKTTILLQTGEQNFESTILLSELFVAHYKSYAMMEKLKG